MNLPFHSTQNNLNKNIFVSSWKAEIKMMKLISEFIFKHSNLSDKQLWIHLFHWINVLSFKKKRIHIQSSEKWQSSYIAHINCSNCCSVYHIARSIYKQEKGKVFQYIRTKIKMTVSPFLLNLETSNFQRIMIWLKVRMC